MNLTLSWKSRRAVRRVLRASSRSKRAFSMVEMLVALAVFLVLLTAVFVPIKVAGDLSSVGTSRANAQQSAVDGIRQIRSDIARAIVILPNDRMVGVTDRYPYTQNKRNVADTLGFPYVRDAQAYTMPSAKDTADGTSAPNACRAGVGVVVAAPNTARLDLILPANGAGSNSFDPNIRTNSLLISYYCRRRDITKAFDPIDNPVVLYRAQIPFQYVDPDPKLGTQPFPAWGTAPSNPSKPPYNADLSNQRFGYISNPASCTGANARGLQWLTMNQYGEFDLTPMSLPQAATPAVTPNGTVPVFGSHQLVLPRDTALITPNAAPFAAPFAAGTPATMGTSLVPDTTFICADTNKDGKIDTVTVQLSVGQYDENSANRRSSDKVGKSTLVPQVARTVTESVFDPNIQ